MENVIQYWPLLLLISWLYYKWWNTRKVIAMLPELRKKGAYFIDVRTPGEFAQASAPNTKNIPLNELSGRIAEIPKNVPIVVCCASGSRSAMAKMMLKKNGYKEVYNIGSWTKTLN